MHSAFATFCRTTLCGLLTLAVLSATAGAQEIRNVARVTFEDDGAPVTVGSNAAVLSRVPYHLFRATGFIFNAKTGEAVDGVEVRLLDSNDVAVQSAMSGPAQRRAGFARVSLAAAPQAGEFRFQPVQQGAYRLGFVLPDGWRLAIGATQASVSGFRGPDGRPVLLEPGSYGRQFSVAYDGEVAIDVPIEPDLPQLRVEMTALASEVSEGDALGYTVTIANDEAAGPVRDGVLTISLPRGFRYAARTLAADNGQQSDPMISGDGETLRVELDDIPAGETATVTYRVRVTSNVRLGDATSTAFVATSMDYASGMAVARVKVRSAFLEERVTIMGRVEAGVCGAGERMGLPGVRVVLETGAWALTDREGLYHFEGVQPGVHVAQVDVASLPKGAKPILCDDDVRKAGSAISHFIDAAGGDVVQANFLVSRPDAVETVATAEAKTAPVDLFAGQSPGTDWVLPTVDANPNAPALHIAIKHAPGAKIELRVNGEPAPAVTFEGAAGSKDGWIEISQWRGVVLKEGDNALDAIVTSKTGDVTRLSRKVHYANTPSRAVLVKEQSRLTADGATRPMIAVRILDAAGKPVRKGMTGGVRVGQPYKLASESAAQQQRQLAGTERAAPVYRVTTDDGLALIELEPTTSAGWVDLAFEFPAAMRARSEPVRAWLSASREDWMVVGYAAGTTGFNTLASNSEALRDTDHDTDFTEGQTAFYAKGRVLGRWLLTLAYDSGKKTDDASLLSAIDPDQYYSLYGDASSVGYDAASSKKLYLRLETDQFYAMFGDFETGFGDTQLARFSRTMTGVKVESAGRTMTFSAFATETAQRNVRDELAGNGLSGPYQLSNLSIISNTDQIRIETRDRYRSEKVLSVKALSRHIDYEINYAAASITFREPVLSKDADFNPVFVVAEYETQGVAEKELTAGGRVTALLFDEQVKVGATIISRREDGALEQLGAVDAVVRLGETASLRVEAGSSTGGVAYLAEVQHATDTIEAVVYFRQQAAEYGLGQSPLGQGGVKKMGIDVRQKTGAEWSLVGSAYKESSMRDASERVYGDIRVEHRSEGRTVFGGARHVADRGATGARATTQALMAGVTQSLLDNTLDVTASTDLVVGGDQTTSYPTRHRIGARYQIFDGLRLIASHEMTPGDGPGGSASQVGFEVEPWAGGRFGSTLNQSKVGEAGSRTFAQYGMSQSLPIGARWTVDASFDGARPVNEEDNVAPSASTPSFASMGAQQRFSALTGGATYRDETWSWNTRLEYRDSDADDRIGIVSNALRQVSDTTSVAMALRVYRQTDAAGYASDMAEGRLGGQHHPAGGDWIVLDKAVMRYEADDKKAMKSMRLVNDIAVSYDAGEANPWRGGAHYGAKYVTEKAASDDADGFVHVIGVDVARRVTPAVDIGVRVDARQARGFETAYSAGPAIGWTPVANTWVSVGYNIVGFHDRDFEEARYTRQGAYFTFRIKFDQTSLSHLSDLVG